MVICSGLASKNNANWMSVADAIVFFGFLLFRVERSKEFLLLCKVVAGPLTGEWEDEYAATPLLLFGGGAPSFTLGGLATLWKNREFDSTMGYPGEDGQLFLLFSSSEHSSFLFSRCSN